MALGWEDASRLPLYVDEILQDPGNRLLIVVAGANGVEDTNLLLDQIKAVDIRERVSLLAWNIEREVFAKPLFRLLDRGLSLVKQVATPTTLLFIPATTDERLLQLPATLTEENLLASLCCDLLGINKIILCSVSEIASDFPVSLLQDPASTRFGLWTADASTSGSSSSSSSDDEKTVCLLKEGTRKRFAKKCRDRHQKHRYHKNNNMPRQEPAVAVPISLRHEARFCQLKSAFMERYSNSYKRRSRHDEIKAKYIVKPESVEKALESRLGDNGRNSLSRASFMKNSTRSIEPSASQLLLFLYYLRRQEAYGMKKEEDAEKIIEWLRQQVAAGDKGVQLDEIISGYTRFYMELSKMRKSDLSTTAAGEETGRDCLREVQTGKTEIESRLFLILAVFGVIPPRSKNLILPLTTRCLAAVANVFAEYRKLNGGGIKQETHFLRQRDLLEVFERGHAGGSLQKQKDIQALMMAFFMSGSGVRPNSVKSNKGYTLHCKEVDDDDDEEAGEFVQLDFAGLAARHVRIYRERREEGDPEGSRRFYSEVIFCQDKVHGLQGHTWRPNGFYYPQRRSDSTLDWSPSIGLALPLICASTGIVQPEDLFSDAKEPAETTRRLLISTEDPDKMGLPIFRAPMVGSREVGRLETDKSIEHHFFAIQTLMDELGLPEALYTAKSFRNGYAINLMTETLLAMNNETNMTKDDVAACLSSTCIWSSRQAMNYASAVCNSLERHSKTSVPTAVSGWLNTIFATSPMAYIDSYKHETFTSFKKRHPEICFFAAAYDSLNHIQLNKSGANRLWRTECRQRFKEAIPADATVDEIRQRHSFSVRQAVDVEKTTVAFAKIMCTKKMAFHEALWYAKTPLQITFFYREYYGYGHVGKKRCPVDQCKARVLPIYSADEANQHWDQEHEANRESLRYKCPCGQHRGTLIWKTFRRHCSEKHVKIEEPFRFHYII